MFTQMEDVQNAGKQNYDVAIKRFGAVSKGFQAIAAQCADYTKASFEAGRTTAEKLVGVTSLEKALALQSDYVSKAFEGFAAHSTKIGQLYADLAKEVTKPVEMTGLVRA